MWAVRAFLRGAVLKGYGQSDTESNTGNIHEPEWRICHSGLLIFPGDVIIIDRCMLKDHITLTGKDKLP